LEDEGILFKKRGIGVFVEKNAKSKIISKQRNEFLLKTLSQTIEKAKLLEINEEVLINQVKKIYGGGNDK
ncbi:MAG: GntR family transcriptional regulator, partial [Candidatus Cloacimonetes bacterium]|nr:GntR family transcriptional regulator [Candidatus Cloacimonadota bacterium]